MNAELQSLHRLARLCGVQTAYIDMAGRRQTVRPEALRGVLKAAGYPADNPGQIRAAAIACARREWQTGLDAVLVAWDHQPAVACLAMPEAHQQSSVRVRISLEDGGIQQLELRAADLQTIARRRVDGVGRVRKRLPLPALPLGYHEIEVAVGRDVSHSLLISAPARSYADEGFQPHWGVFAPVYALHSARSFGAGNFRDWQQFNHWIGSLGGTITASLPLLAQFLEPALFDRSPYSPASRLFWNEFYVDIPSLPEFASCGPARRLAGSSGFRRQLAAFRAERTIDYAAQWAARRALLELLARGFFARPSARRDAFEEYLRRRPEAAEYARFRAACDLWQTPWPAWPAGWRDGDLPAAEVGEPAFRFHAYAQWVADEQLSEAAANLRRRGMKLYLDVPLGVNPAGFDVWRYRPQFALGATTGAPPDMFFIRGQDWGFAPLHPQRLREQAYRHMIDVFRFQMRHAGMVRIDHVMGLHRLYWIPAGFPPDAGAYVSYRPEEFHAILSLESHRHRTLLAGENLGTVPPEVNAAMRRHGWRETYVAQYEQRPDRDTLRPPPRLSVAAVNTHDMPTFAAHWRGLDITDRLKLGLVRNPARERRRRRQRNQAMARFLRRRKLLPSPAPSTGETLSAVLAWLGASSAEVVLATLEDLWLETRPQNVPGTVDQRPNWRRKTRWALEQIPLLPRVRTLLRTLQQARAKAPRPSASPGNERRGGRTRG